MPGQVEFVITAEDKKAIDSLQKLIGKANALGGQMTSAANRGKGQAQRYGSAWDKAQKGILQGAKQIAVALGMTGGIAFAITKVISLVKEWRQNLRDVARETANAGREMTALAMMQQPGKAAEAVRRAATAGARYGIRPGEAWAGVQQLQAQAGGLEPGLAAFESAARLSQFAGVPVENAMQAVSLGMGLGLTPDEAGRAIYGAGKLSSLSPTEMAQMAQKGVAGFTQRTGGPQTGFAVAAQLSEVIKEPGRLGTLTERGRAGLFGAKREELFSGLSKETGIEGTDIIARLKMLRAAGGTGPLGLEKLGFVEKREQQAISLLVNNIDKLESKIRSIRGMTGEKGLIAGERFAAEAGLPQMGFQRWIENIAARTEIEKKMPTTPAAQKLQTQAMEHEKIQRARRLAIIKAGLPDPGEEEDIGPIEWWWAQQRQTFRFMGKSKMDEKLVGHYFEDIMNESAQTEKKGGSMGSEKAILLMVSLLKDISDILRGKKNLQPTLSGVHFEVHGAKGSK